MVGVRSCGLRTVCESLRLKNQSLCADDYATVAKMYRLLVASRNVIERFLSFKYAFNLTSFGVATPTLPGIVSLGDSATSSNVVNSSDGRLLRSIAA